jgi:signal transduction histidine kinase
LGQLFGFWIPNGAGNSWVINNQIGELSSGIAHELNNPLTSVIGFSQLLMEGEVPEDIKKDLRKT